MLKSIDILIGLAVIMLMISMAVTVLTQFVNDLINLRGRQLLRGLAELIHQLDPRMEADMASAIAGEVLLHPLIRGSSLCMAPAFGNVIHREELTKGLMLLASAEPGKTVRPEISQALKGLLQANGIAEPDVTLRNVRQLALEIEKANPALAGDVRQNLALLQEAGSDLVAKINSWFDQTIDRVSERFTGMTRVVTFVCALLVAGTIQLDTLALVNRLAMDDALRESLVKQAQQMTPPATSATAPSPEQQKQATAQYRDFLESRGLLSIPKSLAEWEINWKTLNPFGVLISVFLLNLGAPFWYNALKNLLNLRSVLAAKDDDQRNRRQSSDSESKPETPAKDQTPAAAKATAAVLGERGDLNAIG